MYSKRRITSVMGLILATGLSCAHSSTRPATPSMFSDAMAYEQYMGRWSRRLAPLMADLVSVKDGGRILDVGTGTGALAFALLQSRPTASVVGIDVSQEYVSLARAQNRWGERAHFEVGDAMQLSFAEGSFDAVASLLVVNFLPSPSKALREMIRVTRPGGMVAAAVWDYGGEMQMQRFFWDEAVALDPSIDSKDSRHMPLCKKGELTALWKANGLKDVNETALEFVMHFSSFDDYWAPFTLGQGSAGSYVASLSPQRKNLLEQRLRRRLIGDPSDGPFQLKSRAWLVRGTVP